MTSLLQTSRHFAKTAARSLLERVGCGRLSSMALDHLDLELVEILGRKRHGVFIEAGANDGITQSNTYYLEKVLGWTGLLIEPLPELAATCVRNRPESTVINAALVRRDYPSETVELERANLMSVVNDGIISPEEIESHFDHARLHGQVDRQNSVLVPAKPLGAILEDLKLAEVDFFSLDVEGYELEVLHGIDWSQVTIHNLLVETRPTDKEAMLNLLEQNGYAKSRTWSYPRFENLLFQKGAPS